MFLFISNSYPVASAASIILFCLPLLSSSAFSGMRWAPDAQVQMLQALSSPRFSGYNFTALTITSMTFLLVVWSHLGAHVPAQVPNNERRRSFTLKELQDMVHSLPIEPWLCSDSRAALSVRDLCARLRVRRMLPESAIKRHELVKALDEAPHETLCSICLRDLSDGDKLRLLPCNHYHHCGTPGVPQMTPCESCLRATAAHHLILSLPSLSTLQSAWTDGSSTARAGHPLVHSATPS
jgi:hypothetical protein